MATGTVVTFDEHRGYGTVTAHDGRRLFFHCTAIADGSRSVPVGASVSFSVVPGHRGRWEATDLEVIGDQAAGRTGAASQTSTTSSTGTKASSPWENSQSVAPRADTNETSSRREPPRNET